MHIRSACVRTYDNVAAAPPHPYRDPGGAPQSPPRWSHSGAVGGPGRWRTASGTAPCDPVKGQNDDERPKAAANGGRIASCI